MEGINSIKPEYRLISKSNQLIVAESEKMQELVKVLLTGVSLELETALSEKAMKKIALQVKICEMGARMMNDKYFALNLSPDFGGVSQISAAVFGCRRINDNEIIFSINVYQEIWKEKSDVRLNLPAWDREKVEQFAYYLLYKDMIKSLNAHQCIEFS